MKKYQNKKTFNVISLNVKIIQTLQSSGLTIWMQKSLLFLAIILLLVVYLKL